MDGDRIAKYLAYVLRHNPAELGLELDAQGWCPAELLLERLNAARRTSLTMDDLEAVVAADSKARYSLRNGLIRANQGHSVAVAAVDTTPVQPPARLFHGTTRERWEKIKTSGGLKPMGRHHVHLSADHGTAHQVGSRHRRERPLVLEVDAAAMVSAGIVFYRSENGVWMTDRVPLEYLKPCST